MRSVAGVAIRGNRVFVARRVAGGAMGGKWEFPGGKLESGEHDADAAIREFDEEFGLAITVGATVGQSTFQNNGKHYELAALLVSFDGEPLELRAAGILKWINKDARLPGGKGAF